MIILLSILLTVLGAVAVFLFIRSTQLLKSIDQLEEDILYLEESIFNFKDRLMQAQIRMKEIDIRGAFESDDEVGYTFKELQDIITDTNKFIEELYERNDTKEKI